MTSRRIAGACTLVAGIALAGLGAPAALAAPDCSPAAVDSQVSSITQQAQDYMNAHPDGNKMLMTAALQHQAEAQKTISDYASSNPQEYAGFKSILSPLGTLQSQCGVQVVPAQYQWAFDQFIGS